MANKQTYLGEFEHCVLLSIIQLSENAYGVTIRQYLKNSIKRDVTLGALYTTIERLENKGLINSWKGASKPERGGKAKRMVKVTAQGLQSVKEAKQQLELMWKNIQLLEV
ncbi:MAG: PadR family transcriptional regulator [Colwellia sp.]|nr:PadR family transcriptional regulator [Colwellia sp.]